jgi:hypothetical protein
MSTHPGYEYREYQVITPSTAAYEAEITKSDAENAVLRLEINALRALLHRIADTVMVGDACDACDEIEDLLEEKGF